MHTTTHSAPAIEVLGLTRDFGTTRALDALRFEVGHGELFGLVGPDGSGKTTTLRILAGVLRPSAGDATIEGTSVTRDPEGVKQHIAYMSQRFGLYGDLTVRENIDFYADLYGVSPRDRAARLERLFAFSNLGAFQGRLAGALSGGMKQKLSLSCALIHEPKVLLLDEPTFGVDPISRRELWLIVHEMVARGTTAIVSTAYLDEAERCDRVALLDHGKLAALDAPATLQEELAERSVAIECDDPRRAATIVRALDGVLSAALFGQTLHVTFTPATWPGTLLLQLEAAAIKVRGVQSFEPSLEDVFIERTVLHAH